MANDIKSLVFSFLDSLNIKYTETAPDMWKAMVTPKEVAFFDGRTEYEFTFDRELAEKHRSLEFMSKGSFMLQKITNRLTASPKVARVFAIKEPELPKGVLSVVTEKPYYRTQLAFNFKVLIEGEKKDVKMLSVLSDISTGAIEVGEGFYEVDEEKYSETPNPDYEIRDENQEILRLYIESCQQVEKEIAKDIKLFRAKNQEEYKKSLELFEDYLNDQKAELLKKKENLSFHLYFFQKEEEIDKLINDLEQQREQKIIELKEKYDLKVNVILINALMLCVPTLGEVAQKSKK